MTEPTEQQRNDELAFWAFGWKRHRNWYYDRDGNQVRRALSGTNIWRPFTSHDDAHMLLVECERRNLFGKVEDQFYTVSVHWRNALARGLLAEPDEITEAVEAVAGLGET